MAVPQATHSRFDPPVERPFRKASGPPPMLASSSISSALSSAQNGHVVAEVSWLCWVRFEETGREWWLW